MNEDYRWPLKVVTDYAGDRVSISEGSLKHVKTHHADDSTDITIECVESVLVEPAGGVYRNNPNHSHPDRLNYYSSPADTEYGVTYLQLVVDKVVDPHKVITWYTTDRIGSHGECILEPASGGES